MKTLMLALVLVLTTAGCIKVPEGISIVVTDEPEALCGQYVNCYHAPTRTIVVLPGQSAKLLAHELCHAHQHQTILDETGIEPSLDLREWYGTSEAGAYMAVREAAPVPTEWRLSADTALEDFAEGCGRFLTGSDMEPARAAFFAARGF